MVAHMPPPHHTDGYDVSVLGWPAGHPLHEQAKSILAVSAPGGGGGRGRLAHR